MAEFVAAALSFPTVIFSFLLALVVLYWLLVILGAVDIDLIDVDGVFEGADSAFDGAAEGLDLDVDAGDMDVDGDVDAEGRGGGIANLLHRLGLSGVPITVSMSILVLAAWTLSMAGMRGLALWLPAVGASIVVGAGVGVLAVCVAVVPTAALVKPLRPVFQTVKAPSRRSFVGRICTVVSASVDSHHGVAEIDDGGAGLRVDVRCPQPNSLTRGSRALIFEYEDDDEVYLVRPDDSGLETSDL